MPIRMFESYGYNGILEKVSMNTLEKSILAIDGFWYVKKYFVTSTEEHFTDPCQFFEHFFDKIIELNQKISILWIWDGIEYKQTPASDIDRVTRYISDDIISKLAFKKSLLDYEYYLDFMTEKLRKGGVSVIRAPYSAAAQCSYFLGEKKVDYVFGKTDCLLFKDCTSVITDFDFNNSTVDLINREKLFKACNLDLESFRRFSLLSGCEYCSTHPDFARRFNPADLISMLKKNVDSDQTETNYGLVEGTKYYDEYLQAFYILDHHPVMKLNGKVQCLNEDANSALLVEIFGKTLPADIYEEIFKCNIGAKGLSIMIFDRKDTCFDKKTIQLFKQVFETRKSISFNKTTVFSNWLAEKLELSIKWSPEISSVSQILFHIFLKNDVEPKYLLNLLNAGIKNTNAPKETALPEKPGVDYFAALYHPDILKSFCIFAENHLILKDLLGLIPLHNRPDCDLNFELKLKLFNMPLEKDVLNNFIRNNLSAEDLDKFTELFENQK